MSKIIERQSFRDQLEERIFNIRLKQSNQEIDISNKPNLVKIIELEYAVKYLECLNIEPTQKNISKILKLYPLKNCEISASWKNDTGLYADTITICTRKKKEKKSKDQQNPEQNDNEAVENLNLKKIQTLDILLMEKLQNKEKELNQEINQDQFNQTNKFKDISKEEREELKEQLKKIQQGFRLDYDPENIKQKYIYPFNQTFIRKLNISLKDDEQYIKKLGVVASDNDNKLMPYELAQYHFPFTQIKLEQNELKDLQKPITIQINEIQNKIEEFIDKFPTQMIPTVKKTSNSNKQQGTFNYLKEIKNNLYNDNNSDQEQYKENEQDNKEFLKGRYITFQEEDLEKIMKLFMKDEMARIIGITCHLSYWTLFGYVNPVQIDSLAKKEMYIMMHDIKEYLANQINQKLWNSLGFPMLLLCIKMITELIFKETYILFFEENSYDNNSPGTIAMDKIFSLIDKILDESNFFGRFTFLESDFKNIKKNMTGGKERKYMRKRLYATSPFIDQLIQNPLNSKTRNLLAQKRKDDIKQTSGTIKAIEALPKKQNGVTYVTNRQKHLRVDKSIFNNEEKINELRHTQKQKMVKMIMGKVLPKIDSRITRKLND